MTTTWWERCYEGLRGARLVSPFLRVFTGRFCGCWVVLCLFVLFALFFLAGENSCIQLPFHFFCGFPVVDRPCPVFARQCRKKNFEGQPFFLDHLRTTAEMANDPDSQYFEVLKNGVRLGVKEPPPKSPRIWPTKEELKGESPSDGALKDPRGRGNYASAELHAEDIRKTFLEERDMDMVIGPLTAQKKLSHDVPLQEELVPQGNRCFLPLG